MSTDLDNIEEVFPGASKNPLLISLVEDLDLAKNLRVMATSEAGQAISKALYSKVLELLIKIRTEYKSVSDVELRAFCSALDAQMGLYEELVSSGFIEDAAQATLDEAVEEMAG